MNSISSLVQDIENALGNESGERRNVLLQRITGLFIDQEPDLNDDHISVFDEVILCLALEIEIEARIELSERLADLPRGPRRTIRNLAHDDEIDVAKPVLERSPCLSDEDLAYVARERPVEFLQALTNRGSLPSAVTDILLERGSDDIVQSVAGNSRQVLSDFGLKLLAEKAAGDYRLYRLLRGRPDLALRHVGAILEAAKHRVKSEMADLPDQPDILERALSENGASIFVNPDILGLDDANNGTTEATIVWPAWPTNAERVARQIERGQITEALTGIAYLADISRESVQAAYSAAQFDSLLFMARSVDLEWPAFLALLKAKEGGVLSRERQDRAHASFHALSKSTAKRVMQFIASRLGTTSKGERAHIRSKVR
jgi:Uncharacterised protein conserved in bacteria (DUF2336)